MFARKGIKDRQRKRDVVMRSRNHFCRGKTVHIKYYERVSVLLPYCSGRILLSSVACLAVPYIYILYTIFGGGGFIEHKLFVLILCTTLCGTFFLLTRIRQGIIIGHSN